MRSAKQRQNLLLPVGSEEPELPLSERPELPEPVGSEYDQGPKVPGSEFDSDEPYPQLRHNAKIMQKWQKVWGPSGILGMEGIMFRDVPREESMRKVW